MALREIGEDGSTHDVLQLPHRREFDATWSLISAAHRAAIEAEINRRLDQLVTSPDPNWGSITNTSIEGGKTNPATGVKGDWTGTVFQPIYEVACGMDEERAGMQLDERGESGVNLVFDAGLENYKLYPLRLRRFLHVSDAALGIRIVRV